MLESPTVSDLRARRLELVRATLRETILAGELDSYRTIVESLAEEFDVMDVAAAAVKQADARERGGPEAEIPEAAPPAPAHRMDAPRPMKGRKILTGPARDAKRGRPGPDWKIARLFIGGGRREGIRPGDLVGAIANEVGVSSRAIGAVQIAETHSIVEVPEAIAEQVITALRATRIQGKKVTVRRDREA